MKRHVVCLFEYTGYSARAWADAGYHVFCYDLLHEEETTELVGAGAITKVPWDAFKTIETVELVDRHRGNTVILLSYPPCTDLAVSGAGWFRKKEAADPSYREKAMHLVYLGRDVAEQLNCPYCIENPVSVISSEWRKPNYVFHPYEYGGYLPVDDEHPDYPKYIAPRDAYPKKTCYWTGGGFVMPPKDPVQPEPGYSRQHRLLGGKSARTKRIRNASPRGVASAIFKYNSST